ncbi:CidA/LrgA family protein [Cytobacillus sp. Hz8]|uniref:CidA/LrgA family protein n=1 Tax=Cytobacillus sp. Hz8 TaxID=3347168 RepID=UPI0035D90537
MKLQWGIQTIILTGFLFLGHGMVKLFHLPLPGSIVGMLFLFISLLTGFLKLKWVEQAATFLLKHLTFLFIPPIAGLFISFSFLSILHWNVFLILIVSSVSCLLTSAFMVEWVEKLKRRRANE